MKKNYSDITILIDIDDTIEDLLGAWCSWLNNHYGLDVNKDEIEEWDISRYFPTLTREQVFEPLHKDWFWDLVEPKENAALRVKQLIEDGFNVFLCTTTDYRNVKPKFEKVILKHFPFIPWSNIIVAGRKQMIRADFLVDDGVHNLENGDYVKILVTAAHNRQYDAEKNGMIRENDWDSIYKTIIRLSDEMI